MQTSQPLTEQELKILRQLQVPNKSSFIAGVVIGPLLITGGAFMLLTMWQDGTAFIRCVSIGLVLMGLLVIRGSIKLFFKNRQQEINPLHGQMKQVYSGVLTHTEVIKEKYVRYDFNGFTVDAYIAAGIGNPPFAFRHKRDIERYSTMINIPVKLSVALFEPDVNVVLGIEYDQHHAYTESVVPFEQGDRKKQWRGERGAAGCLIFAAAFCFILFNVVSKFDLNTFLITLGIFVLPALLLIRFLKRTKGDTVAPGENKILVRTVVTEAATLSVKDSDGKSTYFYLRLGNGVLTQVSGAALKHKPGQKIEMEYQQRKNGEKGVLLDSKTV